MLRARAFRPASEKIVRLEIHPTHPWIATADASDNVVVWDWEHRQVVYEVNAGGVDARRYVGAKLQKLADGESEAKNKIIEALRGGSVKQIKFYDEDVRFWHSWLTRNAAAEAPVAVNQQFMASGGGHASVRGRHFLIICCENKVIFLDLVTMRSTDVPKQMLENKSPLCVEFLPRSTVAEGPLIGFGGSDGVIRVISIAIWQLVRKYVGGHKGSVSCMMTFLSSSGETLLVSGGTDGLLVLWTAENMQEPREVSPKQSIKAHDGGVYGIELARVLGGAPQLVTVGADKTLAVWDTVSFKELKRIKPVNKVSCHSVASWCHPRAPALDVLACVKDSNIWAIQHSTYSAVTRPLCDLSSQVPSSLLTPSKKLKCYCMAVHPLQPHLVATGTNLGVILSEFDSKALPSAVALPTPSGSKEHTAAFVVEKEIKLLTFQLAAPFNVGAANSGSVVDPVRSRLESSDSSPLQVKQTKKHIANIPYDVYSCLSVSKSGKYVAVVWPEIPHFAVYRVSDWSVIDSGSARYFAWDTCKERYALLETAVVPRLSQVTKGRKAKEAAAQAAAAAAAAASAAASATVQVRIILEDGSANQLTRAIEGRAEPVIGLQGGALLGVAYKFPKRMSFSNAAAASAASAAQAALSGIAPTFTSVEDGSKTETPSNFQLYSWETFKPVGGLLPQPEWTAWDETVEYCAFAYPQYIVISSLRPQYRYLGNVAIAGATGGVWHRRQLFLATATTIECVFVDAGVSAIDIERKKKKEELKTKQNQAMTVAEHGELALITVEPVKTVVHERVSLRPPMLQVVRLASFQHAPAIPPIISLPKQSRNELDENTALKDVEDKRSSAEAAVAGGGVSVAVSRLPPEQKRPVGPLVVVGVRDGVLWLIDRYMTAHAIALGHPGIRCRCLAAYGDAVSAVKWATRLGREHHDDLAQFMLGMGYATEALHLPGISKRLEFELALQSNDLKRALQCLLTLSNSRNIGQDTDPGNPTTAILSLPSTDEQTAEAVQGIVKYAKEFLDLIDAADATAQTQIAGQALRRLAAAGAIKGALQTHELRGLALRLASHGELTRLGVLVNTMIAAGQGREAALGAALLGDQNLLEKSFQETGMYAEAVLHAQAHGRPSLKTLLQTWNQVLEKDSGMLQSKKASAFSQTGQQTLTDDLVLKELTTTNRKPLIEIVPPGNVILGNTTIGAIKPTVMKQTMAQPGQPSQPGQPLMLEGLKPSQPGQPLMLEGPKPSAPQTSQPLMLEAPPSYSAQLEGVQSQSSAEQALPTTSTIGTPSVVPPNDPAVAAPSPPSAAGINMQPGAVNGNGDSLPYMVQQFPNNVFPTAPLLPNNPAPQQNFPSSMLPSPLPSSAISNLTQPPNSIAVQQFPTMPPPPNSIAMQHIPTMQQPPNSIAVQQIPSMPQPPNSIAMQHIPTNGFTGISYSQTLPTNQPAAISPPVSASNVTTMQPPANTVSTTSSLVDGFNSLTVQSQVSQAPSPPISSALSVSNLVDFLS